MIPSHTDPTVDIIEVEVFRKALVSLTEEMAITLKRASGSSIVVDSHDFSTAIFDAAGEQLAFSGWVTMHCASSRIGVLATIELFRRDPELAPGDAIIVNDPYTSGALHQADVGIVMPLFDGDVLAGWCFSNVHMLDIGGSAIGGLATTAHDVWEEALRFPPTKIAPGGILDPQWELFIATSVRMPDAVINDLRGMIAAGNTAQRKIDELMIRYGADRFRRLSEAAKELSEVALRGKVAQLPDGVYEAQEWIEYDGHEAEELPNMRCRLTISGDNLTVAMAGDPQIDAPVVGTPPAVIGCLMSAMLCMLTYDIPMNEGIWRHVEFDLGPKGTIVNASPPAPVSLSHVGAGFRAGRAFNDVLAQVCSLTDSPELRARVAGAPQNAVPCSIFFGENQFGRATVSVLLSTAIGVGGGAQSPGRWLRLLRRAVHAGNQNARRRGVRDAGAHAGPLPASVDRLRGARRLPRRPWDDRGNRSMVDRSNARDRAKSLRAHPAARIRGRLSRRYGESISDSWKRRPRSARRRGVSDLGSVECRDVAVNLRGCDRP